MGFFPSVAWYQHRCLLEEGTDECNYNSQSQSANPHATCTVHTTAAQLTGSFSYCRSV